MANKIKEAIIAGGFLPIFNHINIQISFGVAKACYDAGLRVFEWTNRGEEAAFLFPLIKEYIDNQCPGMLVGAGTIYDGDTCRYFHEMGAGFIVSPVMEPEMAQVCKELGMLWIPGCGTVTEIYRAQKLGAEIIKIFPGDAVGGPGFIKSLLGPMPWAQIMPTAGVSPDPENLKAWFRAGACCVGMGSQLFTKERISDPDPEKLTAEIRNILNTIKECRIR